VTTPLSATAASVQASDRADSANRSKSIASVSRIAAVESHQHLFVAAVRPSAISRATASSCVERFEQHEEPVLRRTVEHLDEPRASTSRTISSTPEAPYSRASSTW
jgi:hypothetical protein